MLHNPERRCPARKWAILVLALLASTAGASPAVAPSCQTATLNDEEGEPVCTLPASAGVREFRFKARFLGSHDDSQVSLRLIALGGVPVACRQDSKTESRFEDGVVTLDCGFTAPSTTSVGKLAVKISPHYLQLDQAELVVD